MAKLVLDYYDGYDLYTDEEIEDELLAFFSMYGEKEAEKSISHYDKILKFYHMTPIRKGLLYWYEFKEDSTVIEIGGGCGALTSLLCEKCSRVITVELSKKRASIIYERCKHYDNLEIIVANIENIRNLPKADYVVAIGVLEYQGTYSSDNVNPYISFLKRTRDFLKDDGHLLLAIENRFGIKYWVGAPEDHLQKPYEGISGYKKGGKAKTFTKEQLKDMIIKAGFKNTYFYYPMPDYRIATEIYSEDYMPKDSWGLSIVPYYGEFSNSLLVKEQTLYHELFQNSVFDVFANSFLVEAGIEEKHTCKVIYAKSSFDRSDENKICTKIYIDNKVEKQPISSNCENLENCIISSKKINDRCSPRIEALPIRKTENGIVMDYMQLPVLQNLMLNAVSENDSEMLEKLFELYYFAILDSSDVSAKSSEYGILLKELQVELTPSNCFVDGNKLIAFDLEKIQYNKPANFLIYRSLEYLESICKQFEWNYNFDSIKHKYGLNEKLESEYQKELDKYYKNILSEDNVYPLKLKQQIDDGMLDLNIEFISGLGLRLIEELEMLKNSNSQLSKAALNACKDKPIICRKCFNTIIQQLFDTTDNNKVNVVGWGTGECFRRNIEILKIVSDISKVVDSNPEKWGKCEFGDILCISPNEIDVSNNILFIVLVDSIKVAFEINDKIPKRSNIKVVHIVQILEKLRGVYESSDI